MADNNITTKATVAPVSLGNLVIEGIMLPDGSFGVAIPQVFDLFGGDAGLDISDKKIYNKIPQTLVWRQFQE